MKKKISLLLVAVMVLSLVLTACGGSETPTPEDSNDDGQITIQSIKDKGQIVLGTAADYPPFEFHALIDGKDEIVGFDIEIAKYIADELGVELVIEDMEFDKLLGGLATGMLDFVIAGMNPDPERAANFSDIYYEANLAVLVTKDNTEISTVEDLDGKSLGVQIGTTQEDVARETINDADVRALGTNADIIMNLKTNKIDAAIMETPVADSYASVNDDIMVVEALVLDSGSDGVAVALKEGNDELTEAINEMLADMKEQGLIEQWFVEANELVSESL